MAPPPSTSFCCQGTWLPKRKSFTRQLMLPTRKIWQKTFLVAGLSSWKCGESEEGWTLDEFQDVLLILIPHFDITRFTQWNSNLKLSVAASFQPHCCFLMARVRRDPRSWKRCLGIIRTVVLRMKDLWWIRKVPFSPELALIITLVVNQMSQSLVTISLGRRDLDRANPKRFTGSETSKNWGSSQIRLRENVSQKRSP